MQQQISQNSDLRRTLPDSPNEPVEPAMSLTAETTYQQNKPGKWIAQIYLDKCLLLLNDHCLLD